MNNTLIICLCVSHLVLSWTWIILCKWSCIRMNKVIWTAQLYSFGELCWSLSCTLALLWISSSMLSLLLGLHASRVVHPLSLLTACFCSECSLGFLSSSRACRRLFLVQLAMPLCSRCALIFSMGNACTPLRHVPTHIHQHIVHSMQMVLSLSAWIMSKGNVLEKRANTFIHPHISLPN